MFNWETTVKNKGRIKQLILEFVGVPGPNGPGDPNGDVVYEVGYDDGGEFIAVEVHTLHFELAGVQAIVAAIQGTSTMGQARDAVEALLIAQLEKAST
jgi:hypothetical protein